MSSRYFCSAAAPALLREELREPRRADELLFFRSSLPRFSVAGANQSAVPRCLWFNIVRKHLFFYFAEAHGGRVSHRVCVDACATLAKVPGRACRARTAGRVTVLRRGATWKPGTPGFPRKDRHNRADRRGRGVPRIRNVADHGPRVYGKARARVGILRAGHSTQCKAPWFPSDCLAF
jgi:hypothetical protein